MTVAEALREAARLLGPVCDTARLDAELLMAEALGISRSDMLLHCAAREAPGLFSGLVERRLRHEPLAYIVGRQEFYGRDFAVGPAVLIPRADSETIVRAALDACPEPRCVLDCGTGSGALLVTLLAEYPAATGIGVDSSAKALEIARANAARHIGNERAAMVLADWHRRGWAGGLGRFDLVIANPPYVETAAPLEPSVREWEPHAALFAGEEGLDQYRALIPQLPQLLETGGIAVLEIGSTQAQAVGAIARAACFNTSIINDLGDRPRAMVLRGS